MAKTGECAPERLGRAPGMPEAELSGTSRVLSLPMRIGHLFLKHTARVILAYTLP